VTLKSHRLFNPANRWHGWLLALLRRSNSETAIENPQIKISSPASAANASGFIQIPLSQVPRREALGSTRTLGAGALVDRALRFIANWPTERASTFPGSSVKRCPACKNHDAPLLRTMKSYMQEIGNKVFTMATGTRRSENENAQHPPYEE
jgi:hypothetical protein